MTGKEKCEFLKEIRKNIAEEYNIPYNPSECKHEGECSGTCPKCEAELKYLTEEIDKKRAAGVEVNISPNLSELLGITHDENFLNGFSAVCGDQEPQLLSNSRASEEALTGDVVSDYVPPDDWVVKCGEEDSADYGSRNLTQLAGGAITEPLAGVVPPILSDSEVQAHKIYSEIRYILSEYGYEETARIYARIEMLENELQELRKRKNELKKRQSDNLKKFDKYFSDLASLLKEEKEQ